MGIVCHLANGPEGRVYRAGRYITVIRPTILLWLEWRCWLARLALCARRIGAVDRRFESEVRQKPKGKDWLLSNNGGSDGIGRTEDARPGAEVASMRTSTFEEGRLCEKSRMGHGLVRCNR